MNKSTSVALLHSLYAIYLNSSGEFKKLKSEIQTAVSSTELKPTLAFLDQEFFNTLKRVYTGANTDLKPVGVSLKNFLANHSSEVQPPVADLLKAFSLYFRTGSESAAKTIQKNSSSSVFQPWVRSNMLAKAPKQSSVADKLKSFVNDITGEDRMALTREETDDLKSLDSVLYKEYTALRRQLSDSWKAEVQNYVRNSGRATVPMQDLLSHLDDLSLEYQIPSGFTGNVNADLEWFTSDGKRLSGAPAFTTYDRVQMNEARKPGEYYFIALPREGSGSQTKYFYLSEDVAAKRAKKFQTVKDVAPTIKSARQKWLKGIKTFDMGDAKTVASLIIELSYQFASRIGSPGNATAGSATFGLSTVEMRHLKMSTTGFVLKYPGKDGVATTHKFVARDSIGKQILTCMEELAEGKQPDDRVFTVTLKNGESRPISASIVNQVFKSVMGTEDITIHKIRTLRATVLFNDQVEEFLASHGDKELTTKHAEELTKKFATNVGKELNHVRTSGDGEAKVTPLTALASYIDLSAQTKLFDHYGLTYPKYLLRSLGKNRLEAKRLLAEFFSGEVLTAAPEDKPTVDSESKESDKPDQEEPSDDQPSGEDSELDFIPSDPNAELLEELLSDPSQADDA